MAGTFLVLHQLQVEVFVPVMAEAQAERQHMAGAV